MRPPGNPGGAALGPARCGGGNRGAALQLGQQQSELCMRDVGALQALASLGVEPATSGRSSAYEWEPETDETATRARAALRSLPVPEATTVVRDFLTALAAKDCSVIASFVQLPPGPRGTADEEDERVSWLNTYGDEQQLQTFLLPGPTEHVDYLCRVIVIDTDIRSVHRVWTYHAADRAIVRAALNARDPFCVLRE